MSVARIDRVRRSCPNERRASFDRMFSRDDQVRPASVSVLGRDPVECCERLVAVNSSPTCISATTNNDDERRDFLFGGARDDFIAAECRFGGSHRIDESAELAAAQAKSRVRAAGSTV